MRSMRIELNCSQCGDNRFTIVQAIKDNAVVRCSECGHVIGTMDELKERVAGEVISAQPRLFLIGLSLRHVLETLFPTALRPRPR